MGGQIVKKKYCFYNYILRAKYYIIKEKSVSIFKTKIKVFFNDYSTYHANQWLPDPIWNKIAVDIFHAIALLRFYN